jgi:nucleotide-binding universal stress UspA family protein
VKPAQDAGAPCLVLGYDRTNSSRRAARWAASELPANGKLVIVHACRPLHAPPPPLSTVQERERLGRAVIDELLLDGEDSLFDVDLLTEVSDDDPVTALTGAARRHGARAIVVGCEQHSRLHKALGTVTSELLKSAPVPVTIVPSAAPTTDAG